MARKNLILTCADERFGDLLSDHWHRSLRENVDTTDMDVVVVDYGLSDTQRQRLTSHGVTCVSGQPSGGLIVNRRFRDYAAVLNAGDYDQVLTIDGGDVIFQSDISHLFREHTSSFRCVTQDRRASDLDSSMAGSDFEMATWLQMTDFLRAGRRKMTTSGVLGPVEKIRKIWSGLESNCRSLDEYGTDLAMINYLLHREGFVELPSRYEFVPGSTREKFFVREGVFYDQQGGIIPVIHNAGGEMSRRIQNFGYGKNCNSEQRVRPLWRRVTGRTKYRLHDLRRGWERRRVAGKDTTAFRAPAGTLQPAPLQSSRPAANGTPGLSRKAAASDGPPSRAAASNKLQVVLFQRQPAPSQFSIERHFACVREQFQARYPNLEMRTYVMPFLSQGVFRRVGNMIAAWWNRGEINHITGDVHYVALVLPAARTLMTIHDCQVLERLTGWRRAIVKLLWFTLPIKRVAALTCVSKETRERLLEQMSGPIAEMHIAHSPVSKGIPAVPKPFALERPRILQIGTKANKNLYRLIDALRDIECVLEIVGPLDQGLRHHLAASNVIYESSSRITDEELAECYARCDIVSFVSTYEGFGMPIIEAQWAERPVITSSCSCMPDTAGDGACLVDPFSVQSIRDGVLRVINDSEYRERIVNAGKQNRLRFDAATVADCYAKVYRELNLKLSKRSAGTLEVAAAEQKALSPNIRATTSTRKVAARPLASKR